MPFQHSEELDDQQRSVALFTALGDESKLGFARKHLEVIERFGPLSASQSDPRPPRPARGDRSRQCGPLVVALVELAVFYNSFEAGIVHGRMESEGLETVLFDFNASMGEGASFLIPIRLMISEEDEAAARRILEEAGRA
jgi:hypothetical protein